jgi:pyruvate dehydrogenase E2 component (dihydrolipoamide acetyltransferase)
VARLAAAARDRSLTAAELAGATFTISNIGAVGGGYGTPIIPWGTTAILSIGALRDTPIAATNMEATSVPTVTVESVPTFPLSLSYDHRAIDGATGRRFMAAMAGSIELAEGLRQALADLDAEGGS